MAEIEVISTKHMSRTILPRLKDKSLSRTAKFLQPTLKRELRRRLTKLDNAMIRRHRIPYHEALCTELRENGYDNSAYYIESLVRYNEEIRNAFGPDTFFWTQPTLADTKEHLDVLRGGLEEAERAHLDHDLRVESRSFLRMGIHFTRLPATWWWIAEQLLLESIDVATEYRDDGHRQETVSRYVFGRFSVLQLTDVDEGRDQLKLCREYSTSKTWTASDELGIEQETIFVESCTLLSYVMFEQARRERTTDPYKASRTAAIALKRATETGNETVRARGYLEIGVCKLCCDSPTETIDMFERSLELYERTRDVAGACETLMHTASACAKLDKPDALDDCERRLLDMLALAADYETTYWEATAHKHIGLFYLHYRKNDDGEAHLSTAFELFHDADNADETLKTRCLAGIAAGQNRFENYAKIVSKAGRHDVLMKNVMKIVDWKDARDPFRSDDEETTRSMTDLRKIASTLSLRTIIDEMLLECV